ncbi:hypothetical protein AB0K57_20750 [Streptomyces halstedii]|uniref:hypothetical protein n=1 Tax=Streptomyces halstedii TaxID=1944 RepID=UPI003461388B
MMPEITTTSRIASQATGVTSPAMVGIEDLSAGERSVALYASDMPNRYRTTDDVQIIEWVMQGIDRVGLDEVRRRASYAEGYRRLTRVRMATPQLAARHEQNFPKGNRLLVADRHAANLGLYAPMSPDARTRNRAADVDGTCPCKGTRTIPLWQDADAAVGLACPVHAATRRPAVQA